jgi:hypothetical protein
MTKQQKFLLLVVLIIAGASVTYYYNQTPAVAPTDTTTPQAQVPATIPTTPTGGTPVSQIPAHSFSSDVTYQTPENGSETIHVTVSLTGDIINDISFTYDAPKKRESKQYIASFEKSFSASSLKGTKLSDLSLSRIGGASLTTGAFMQAISKIRTDSTNG